ncbi:nucleotidyltransferase domain-containing protein [Candidatus Chloroploca sp. M-50]|uniref:Nucleotidyltransferase domain-containing protein n=1 Tax=Candidatus Chloroploca mongolica TaxID=2528176 RepID=A0ABS4D666_9CHLR|nr:nucleotidyltransferase domain-containing protein [Candidatus Chloroploca mongolica]MBP1464924.1 nucleotidyltransferase domain-containing protein [Candidatus Chloroploca mongolica]
MAQLPAEILAYRDEILQIAARHGIHSVSVFGSFVHGTADAHSDLDLLIEAGTETSPFFPGGLVADLEQLLGRRVDVVEPDGLYAPLRVRILSEAIPL